MHALHGIGVLQRTMTGLVGDDMARTQSAQKAQSLDMANKRLAKVL